MYVLVGSAVIVAAIGAYAADRAVNSARQRRRRREASARLAAAAAQAEARDEERRAKQAASAALTSVMPGIHEHGPRRVA